MGGDSRRQTRPRWSTRLTYGAVIAPGYGGTEEQPIVRAMAHRLNELGFTTQAVSFSRTRPTGDYAPELNDLRRARAELHTEKMALVGRSFGGRMCTRLAAAEPPDALVVLGHPIGPKDRPRPDDEAALARARCPTLIVQGEHDHLGPLNVLRRIAKDNANIEIYVLTGVGHNFGPRQAEGLDRAAAWLLETLARS